jgi:hypothetical protein
MRDDWVRNVLEELAGRKICAPCADAFLDVLDTVRARPLARHDVAVDAGDDSGRSS